MSLAHTSAELINRTAAILGKFGFLAKRWDRLRTTPSAVALMTCWQEISKIVVIDFARRHSQRLFRDRITIGCDLCGRRIFPTSRSTSGQWNSMSNGCAT